MFKKVYITALATVMATLLVAAFAHQAYAYQEAGNRPFTYAGKIISFDKDSMWITVQARMNDEMSFRLANDAEVTLCDGKSKNFSDLKVGDHVAISYFEEGTTGYVASNVIRLSGKLHHC